MQIPNTWAAPEVDSDVKNACKLMLSVDSRDGSERNAEDSERWTPPQDRFATGISLNAPGIAQLALRQKVPASAELGRCFEQRPARSQMPGRASARRFLEPSPCYSNSEHYEKLSMRAYLVRANRHWPSISPKAAVTLPRDITAATPASSRQLKRNSSPTCWYTIRWRSTRHAAWH